jgi:transcriptional regulator with XRE-family HTH domain
MMPTFVKRAGIDIIREFGLTVRKRRMALNLSQETLAERADLHRTYVADIERGVRNVSLKNIQKLARSLGVSVSDLFAGLRKDSQA